MAYTEYFTPTHVYFGKETEKLAGKVLKENGASKVLLHYGSGSAEKSGLLNVIRTSLKENGITFVELGGVQPNPRLSLARKGIELCRKQGVDFILAVGGGSVLDSAKCIGYGVPYDGDVWDFFEKGISPKQVLPIGVIATTASSGSETSNAAILSSGEWKLGFEDDRIIPKFAIMNPKYTVGLPAYQTFVGIADVLSHLLERYFSDEKNSDTTDYLIEGAIRALLVNADKLLANQKDVNARGEIQWLASVAHGGFLDAGRRADWGSHRIEHELSAQYNITHGEGMAVVTVAWTKYMAEKKPWRLALLASRVFGVDSFNYSETERAYILSEKLAAFFKKLHLATSLAELKIDNKDFDAMAARATRNGKVGHYVPLDATAIKDILKIAL